MELMNFVETEKILKKYGLPFLPAKLCRTKEQARASALRVGYPVVLKIASTEIIHKTDVGGVKLNIKSDKELARAFIDIANINKGRKGGKEIEGVLVQKQVAEKEGKMVIIGMKRDLSFGPVMMFGLGGIWVEVFNDVCFRLAPVSKAEAEKMIEEIRGYPLLKGHRGEKGVNLRQLAEIIARTSSLAVKEKEIKQIDFNPVWANEKQALIIDARFLV